MWSEHLIYIILYIFQNVGIALRDLLQSVDAILSTLPTDCHSRVSTKTFNVFN